MWTRASQPAEGREHPPQAPASQPGGLDFPANFSTSCRDGHLSGCRAPGLTARLSAGQHGAAHALPGGPPSSPWGLPPPLVCAGLSRPEAPKDQGSIGRPWTMSSSVGIGLIIRPNLQSSQAWTTPFLSETDISLWGLGKEQHPGAYDKPGRGTEPSYSSLLFVWNTGHFTRHLTFRGVVQGCRVGWR